MLKTKFDQFKQLHNEKEALILYNCWDVATALALEENGASAIATSSYALAQAWGFPDGQKMTFTEFYWFISRIASHITKPFTVDIEARAKPIRSKYEATVYLRYCWCQF